MTEQIKSLISLEKHFVALLSSLAPEDMSNFALSRLNLISHSIDKRWSELFPNEEVEGMLEVREYVDPDADTHSQIQGSIVDGGGPHLRDGMDSLEEDLAIEDRLNEKDEKFVSETLDESVLVSSRAKEAITAGETFLQALQKTSIQQAPEEDVRELKDLFVEYLLAAKDGQREIKPASQCAND